jgi:alpha-N-arabinofuranosidase
MPDEVPVADADMPEGYLRMHDTLWLAGHTDVRQNAGEMFMSRMARCAGIIILTGVWPAVWTWGGLAAEQDKGREAPGTGRPETISIVNERISTRPIDLKQGGQFIEPLCNLIPSMLAQQVAGDSFEEEPPYKVAYKQEIDKPFRPWYPDSAVHTAQYSFDTEKPFNGKRSQKIVLNGSHCRAGISQDGFSLKEGVAYHLRLHARSEANVPVRACLHGGGRMLAGPVEWGAASADWTPLEADLRVTGACDNATLTLEGEGSGTLWLDRVCLIGEDAILGIWRPDVVDALRAMNPGVVRWGGSTMEGYEWDRCIGPWDKREPFSTCWGGLEPNFVGVEEFIQLCQHIGAEPLICLRWSGKTPGDAASQVEYFNGAPDTKWGRTRAENGHAEPYHVKYWQIGNEVGGKEYDASVRTFAEAMKKAGPDIKILSAFLTNKTLAEGGDYLDYLCPHHYGCADLRGKSRDFERIREQIACNGRGRDVRVAVTEWNTTAGDWNLGRGTLQTLSNALACARYHNLMHRNADLVEIAIRSNLVDSFGSGVIQTGPGWLYLAPTYYVQQLYQRAAGSWPLHINRPTAQPWPDQTLDLSAALGEDGKTLRLYAVNTAADSIKATFHMEGFPSRIAKASQTILKDREDTGTAEVMNSRDDPLRIGPKTDALEVSGAEFPVTFTPLSLTLLELSLDKS